jgi:hypothetical protein
MSTRSTGRRLLAGAGGGTALLATLALFGVGATSAGAAGCPNEQLRVENHSTTLPDCRAYEQVTPTYKQGIGLGSESGLAFGSILNGLADDGEGVSYISIGNFSSSGQSIGSAYFAKRTPSGWMTVAAQPSAAEYDGISAEATEARTPDLETALFTARRPTDPSNARRFYLGNVDGAVTEIGPIIPLAATTHPPGIVSTRPNAVNSGGASFAGASEDLSDVTFSESDHEVNFPGDELTGEGESLLEYVGAEGHDPRVVSVNNEGKEFDACGVGHSSLISRDGRIVAFEQTACEGQARAVYARVGGETTVDLSSSQCTRTSGDPGGACNEPSGATLAGGSPNGSITYFITSQQLVNSDIDQGRDLYACILPAGAIAPQGDVNSCPDLEPISVTGTAAGANVPEVENVAGGETAQARVNFQEVIHVSKDGSHVEFTATGVLTGTGTNGAGQHAVEGAENVYMFNHDAPAGERLKFVSDLCSGSGMSGSAADPLCPPSPSANDAAPATFKQGPYMQLTADGHYLLFATYARLGAGDTDEGQDVYRYDAETGALVRISIGQDGYGNNGNATNANAWIEQAAPAPRMSISEDGEQVFFTTPEALVPQDSNGVNDVYQWENGQVYLISDGVAPGGSVLWTVNPSGENVLFSTADQLTSSDGDTAWDVYDAHVDGGFPVPPTPASCSGEACQGSPPTAGALPSPGSATLTGGGNIASAAGSPSPLTVSAAKTITGPGGTLSVKLAGRGRLVISGSGLKSTSVSVAKAGSVTVKVMLTNQARAKLRKRHTLKISAKVLFTPSSGQAATTTVALTFKEAHSSKSASKARKGHS